MCKNSFKIIIDFKADLKLSLKFMSCLEIRAVLKMCQNSPLLPNSLIITKTFQKGEPADYGNLGTLLHLLVNTKKIKKTPRKRLQSETKLITKREKQQRKLRITV